MKFDEIFFSFILKTWPPYTFPELVSAFEQNENLT